MTPVLIEACGGSPQSKRAVDVGAGTNLDPSLLMLPRAEHIVFTEQARQNVKWLGENLADATGEWSWKPFRDFVAGLPFYRAIDNPRRRLAAVDGITTDP